MARRLGAFHMGLAKSRSHKKEPLLVGPTLRERPSPGERHMTGRERVLAMLRGEKPDRVPFCPNIGQWFDFHRHRGTLPEELQGCRDELEAMLALGCDIFSRRLCHPIRTVERPEEVITQDLGNGWRCTEIHTPVGTLTQLTKFEEGSWTTYTHEHFLKDFHRDFPVLRFILERTRWAFDEEAFRRAEARVGEAGVVMVPFFQSPIKLLHNWAGQEAASYFLMDHPNECRELFQVFTAKVLEVARQAANSSALVFCTMDNLDTPFHSPPLFREFALPFYQALAEVFHARGKWLFSHACGRLWGLRGLIAEAGLDGLEAIPHPPLGDLPLPEAKRIHPRFIVNGGITVHEAEVFTPDARERIFAYVRRLFADMAPLERFLFSTACNTSLRTPWANLLHFRDACWEWGGL